MPGPRRLRPAVLVLVGLTLLLAACDVAGLLEVDLTGQLLDVGGVPVAGAVVFVPEGSSSLLSTSSTGTGCQAPSEDFAARTCTDAQGRYTLRVSPPVLGSLKLVFENLYWRAERTIDLGLRVPGEPIAVDPVGFPPFETGGKELEVAVSYALPSIAAFQLITLNTEKEVVALEEHAGASAAGQVPIRLRLPILQPGASIPYFISWTAYHVNVRVEKVQDCAIGLETDEVEACEVVAGPSLTFQGMPDMSDEQLQAMVKDEKGTFEALQNEAVYQMSVLAVIGNELEGTYYGAELEAPHTPSSLQGLRSVLDTHYDEQTVERLLASGGGVNYLLHNQIDLLPFDADRELHGEFPGASAADAGPARTDIRPADHFFEGGTKFLNVVMVADSTVWDAVEQRRLVPNYFARVDAMANRQDAFFRFVQISGTQAPASLTAVDPSNAFSVRTRIAGYRRLTVAGQERLSFPTNSCGDAGSLIDIYRTLSWDKHTYDNEYWMWWTNTTAYPGTWGCAYIARLHLTPRGGAVGWTSFRNYTLETVGQTFMHETGHLVDARHNATVTSHRCRLLGIFAIGVTGPSIMGGTSDRNLRTNCFAVTPSNATSLRNRTRVAEYLHLRLE